MLGKLDVAHTNFHLGAIVEIPGNIEKKSQPMKMTGTRTIPTITYFVQHFLDFLSDLTRQALCRKCQGILFLFDELGMGTHR